MALQVRVILLQEHMNLCYFILQNLEKLFTQIPHFCPLLSLKQQPGMCTASVSRRTVLTVLNVLPCVAQISWRWDVQPPLAHHTVVCWRACGGVSPFSCKVLFWYLRHPFYGEEENTVFFATCLLLQKFLPLLSGSILFLMFLHLFLERHTLFSWASLLKKCSLTKLSVQWSAEFVFVVYWMMNILQRLLQLMRSSPTIGVSSSNSH